MSTLRFENSVPKTSFFDLQRAAIVRESPSLRLRKASIGECFRKTDENQLTESYVSLYLIDGNIAAVRRLIKMVPNIQNPDPDNG